MIGGWWAWLWLCALAAAIKLPAHEHAALMRVYDAICAEGAGAKNHLYCPRFAADADCVNTESDGYTRLVCDTGTVTKLTLRGNQAVLSGTISSWLGQLTSLRNLYWCCSNAVSGTLPTELGRLTNVEEFIIRTSRISGTVPSEFCRLSRMTRLDIQHTDISGVFPSACGDTMTNLREQSFLFGNKLVGPAPELGQYGADCRLSQSSDSNCFSSCPQNCCADPRRCPFEPADVAEPALTPVPPIPSPPTPSPPTPSPPTPSPPTPSPPTPSPPTPSPPTPSPPTPVPTRLPTPPLGAPCNSFGACAICAGTGPPASMSQCVWCASGVDDGVCGAAADGCEGAEVSTVEASAQCPTTAPTPTPTVAHQTLLNVPSTFLGPIPTSITEEAGPASDTSLSSPSAADEVLTATTTEGPAPATFEWWWALVGVLGLCCCGALIVGGVIAWCRRRGGDEYVGARLSRIELPVAAQQQQEYGRIDFDTTSTSPSSQRTNQYGQISPMAENDSAGNVHYATVGRANSVHYMDGNGSAGHTSVHYASVASADNSVHYATTSVQSTGTYAPIDHGRPTVLYESLAPTVSYDSARV